MKTTHTIVATGKLTDFAVRQVAQPDSLQHRQPLAVEVGEGAVDREIARADLALAPVAPLGRLRAAIDLRRKLDIPATVTALGLARAEFGRIADLAATDICAGMNPVPVDTGSLRSILDAAA